MNRVKLFRITVAVFTTLLIIATASVTLFISMFPRERLLGIITSRAEKVLNRKVTIGSLHYGITGLRIRDIAVYEDITGNAGIFAQAESGRVALSLSGLLKKELHIQYILVNNMKLAIVYKGDSSNLGNLIGELLSTPESEYTANLAFVKVQNAEITLKNPPAYLRPLTGTYNLSCLLDLRGQNAIDISNLKIGMPARRGTIKGDLKLEELSSKFRITGDLNLENCVLGWVYTWQDNFTLPFRNFNGRVEKLLITKDLVSGAAKGNSNLDNGATLHASGKCTVGIPSGNTIVYDTSASIEKSRARLKNLSIIPGRGVTKLVVEDMNVMLDHMKGLIPFIAGSMKGEMTGEFSYDNKLLSARITIKNGAFGEKGALINGLNETFVINSGVMAKENISVNIMGNPAKVSIATTDRKFMKFALNIDAPKLKIDTGETKTYSDPTGYLLKDTGMEVSGRISIGEASIGQTNIHDTQVYYRLQQGKVLINRFTSKMHSGQIMGAGRISPEKKGIKLEFDVAFDRLKVQSLTARSDKFKDRFFGMASGRLSLGFTVSDRKDIMKSFQGRGDVRIQNGKIANTGIQNGLGAWLAELRHKLKDIEFSDIHGNFQVDGGRYQINSLSFKAPDIRLDVSGNVQQDLQGDLKIDLQFNRNFIIDLPNPAFIQLAKYKKGGWYSIPFEVRGKDITDSKNMRRLY